MRLEKLLLDKKEWKILSADYSQIELRVMAHFSNDDELIKSFKGMKTFTRGQQAKYLMLN